MTKRERAGAREREELWLLAGGLLEQDDNPHPQTKTKPTTTAGGRNTPQHEPARERAYERTLVWQLLRARARTTPLHHNRAQRKGDHTNNSLLALPVTDDDAAALFAVCVFCFFAFVCWFVFVLLGLALAAPSPHSSADLLASLVRTTTTPFEPPPPATTAAAAAAAVRERLLGA